jgi:hypothetical protein
VAVQVDVRRSDADDPPRVVFHQSRLAHGLSMRIFISESVGDVDAVASLLRATANMLEDGRFLGTRSEMADRQTPPPPSPS